MKEEFQKQTELLIECLPALRARPEFALKGGTAINLFLFDLPRVSVDLDLVYLPLDDRETALAGIEKGLSGLARDIESSVPNAKIDLKTSPETKTVIKAIVRRGLATRL